MRRFAEELRVGRLCRSLNMGRGELGRLPAELVDRLMVIDEAWEEWANDDR